MSESTRALERISLLLNLGSFKEILSGVEYQGPENVRRGGDGVLAGIGTVDGREVAVYAHEPIFLGGSLGAVGAGKIARLYGLAVKYGIPIIALSDSSGARIHEGPKSLMAVAELFRAVRRAVGRVPQITAVLGGCVGGAAFSAAMGDLVVGCSGRGYIFVNGPTAVKKIIGEDVTVAELGGVDVLARTSGMIDLLAKDEVETITLVKRLLTYLPSNHREPPPTYGNSLDSPDRHSKFSLEPDGSYEVEGVVAEVFDKGSSLKLQNFYAPSVFTGLARLDGIPVGVVANRPKHMGGLIDVDAAVKICRLVRLCSSFNLPIITLVDTQGFAPGSVQEHRGLVRVGSDIFRAYLDARVPKVSVILGRAYGGAYIAMSSKGLGADYAIALPSAEVAVLEPSLAAEIMYRKELEGFSPESRLNALREYEGELRRRYSGDALLALGVVDKLVEPEDVRPTLVKVVKGLYASYCSQLTP